MLLRVKDHLLGGDAPTQGVLINVFIIGFPFQARIPGDISLCNVRGR